MQLIGKRIRYCRQLLGMTQTELAGDEFTKSFISQLEMGKAVPSIKALLVLAEKLRQRPGYFLEPEAEVDLEAIVSALKERLDGGKLRQSRSRKKATL